MARNRASLLRATQEVLASLGPDASLETIADHAQISVSTIYKHFENKDALFSMAYIDALQGWESWVTSMMKDLTDPAERLVFPMRLMAQVPHTHPMLAAMVTQNPMALIESVPQADMGLEQSLVALAKAGVVSVPTLELRAKNMLTLLSATLINMCTNPKMTQSEGFAAISIGLEMFGLSRDLIDDLMQRPLPPLQPM